MSWYWIVLIAAVWLSGWTWGSRYVHNISPVKEAFGEKDFLTICYALIVGLLWPLIGYVACVYMLYKRHVARTTSKHPDGYPGPWMANDVIFILIFSLAWPAIFAVQYSLKRMVHSATT